jgi:hypothetical protein
MQIFVLDSDPIKAAQMHNNKHIVKMVLESCQLLCSVHHLTSDKKDIPYRLSHKNHPCAKWARESFSNYIWLLDLTRALLDEYTHRYGKKHASERVYEWCSINLPKIEDKGLTPFAQAIPEHLKSDDAVQSYRRFYIEEKISFCKYTNRQIPDWLKSYI